MTSVLMRRIKLDTETQREDGHVNTETATGVMQSQPEMPEITGNHQKPGLSRSSTGMTTSSPRTSLPIVPSGYNDCHSFPDLLRCPPVLGPSHFLPGRTKVLLGPQSTLCPPLISCLLGSIAVDFPPGASSTIAGRRSYSLHNPSTLQSNGNGIE